MAEVLNKRMDIERAKRAMERLHRANHPPGARRDGRRAASFRGLPCPNLKHRRQRFHGPYEHITAEHYGRKRLT